MVSDSTITVSSPPGAGTVDVTVTAPGGTSHANPADRFNYTAIVAAPIVNGISPSSGPAAGGTLVTISGAGFTGATIVQFGTTAAQDVVIVSDGTITAKSPAGTDIVNVTVTTPSGTSATSSSTQFTYAARRPQRLHRRSSPASTIRVSRAAHVAGSRLQCGTQTLLPLATSIIIALSTMWAGCGVGGKNVGHVTPVAAAVYDPSTRSVTLFPAQRLDIHNTYRLTVSGSGTAAIKGITGVPLAGASGASGTDYVRLVTGKLLAGPAPVLQVKVCKRLLHSAAHEHNRGAKAASVESLALRSRATLWAKVPRLGLGSRRGPSS